MLEKILGLGGLVQKFGFSRDDAKWIWGEIVGLAILITTGGLTAFGVDLSAYMTPEHLKMVMGLCAFIVWVSARNGNSSLPGKNDDNTLKDGGGSSSINKTAAVLLLALMLPFVQGCVPPPALAPADVIKWRADQAIVALDVAQDAVIALNKVQVCANATPCHPLIPNDDAKLSIDTLTAAAQTIAKIPSGWLATALAAIDNLEKHFNHASAFYAYLETARGVLNAVSARVP